MLRFDELESITGGNLLQFYFDAPITELMTDSRNATRHSGVLFFAISGERHDGHHYIRELYAEGIRQFIIESAVDITDFVEANFFVVENAVTALQQVALHHRSQFDIPVVGITGSNGKTIVKEWLHQMLSPFKHIIKTPHSYNSQIGVPLSVWKMAPDHDLGIFEAGISKSGEMQALEKIIRPQTGIFTNIGPAHDEGFADVDEKIREKALLFENCDIVIYCRDYEQIHTNRVASPVKSLTWGFHEASDIRIIETNLIRGKSEVLIEYEGKASVLRFPFVDWASIENAMHCVAYMLCERYDLKVIRGSLENLKSLKMRLELKEGINQSYIIDDSYSNDLQGLSVALDFMGQHQLKGRKTLILSDILESGMGEGKLYRTVADMIRDKGVGRLIGIGPALVRNQAEFEASADFYQNTDQYLADFDANDYHDEVILVKGARVFGFERLAHRLEQKIHGTVLEINLNALVNNLNYYRSRIKKGTKIMVMVKAFAYGSRSREVASLLQFHKVDYLAVAYADEGVSLRRQGITLPIMVMNPSVESFAMLLQYGLEPELYSLTILRSFLTFLAGREANAHLKIDTGMHRLGFSAVDKDALLARLEAHPNLGIVSVFSHLAGADEEGHEMFSSQQAEAFEKYYREIEKVLPNQPIRHLVNSAGILRFGQYHYDMVRLGIGLYGIEGNNMAQHCLENVSTLKTVVSQVRHIPMGDSIGYGRKGLAQEAMDVATIAIGYADGFSRTFGNGVGSVMIDGQEMPVIGNVCMDMCMVDVTGYTVEAGDEVIIFGDGLPISTLAKRLRTIPYEILTNVSQRVKRVFYKE